MAWLLHRYLATIIFNQKQKEQTMNTTALAEERWTNNPTSLADNKQHLFNQLFNSYGNDMKRYAYWLAGDKHTAEDLLQEALLRAWKSLDKLQNIKAAKGWLLTILRRENARRFERYRPVESNIPLDELSARETSYDTSTEAFVLRRSMPWASAEGEGLVFVSFGKSFDAFEALLGRMMGKDDGIVDALFRFTRPVSGCYYWCPPVKDGKLDLSVLGLS